MINSNKKLIQHTHCLAYIFCHQSKTKKLLICWLKKYWLLKFLFYDLYFERIHRMSQTFIYSLYSLWFLLRQHFYSHPLLFYAHYYHLPKTNTIIRNHIVTSCIQSKKNNNYFDKSMLFILSDVSDVFLQSILPLLFSVNLPLVEFIHILTVFHHLSISLVLFTDSLIDASEFALVGLNCTMN